MTLTDPRGRDTDGDGLTDGEEVLKIGLPARYLGIVNPLKVDTDGDGLADSLELGMTTATLNSRIRAPYTKTVEFTDESTTAAVIRYTTATLRGTGWYSVTGALQLWDSDPSSITNPSARDTDRDGYYDGMDMWTANGNHELVFRKGEEKVGDGQFKPGGEDGLVGSDDDETDPNDPNSYPMTNVILGVDSDYDGLTDEQETEIGSNPADSDTDDDGLTDGWEVTGHTTTTTPLIIYMTTDLLKDVVTDPLNPDTDGDGRPDGLEVGIYQVVTRTVNGNTVTDTDTNRTFEYFNPLTESIETVNTYIADADSGNPATSTSPAMWDSNNDGKSDDEQDANRDGKIDSGEEDPVFGLWIEASVALSYTTRSLYLTPYNISDTLDSPDYVIFKSGSHTNPSGGYQIGQDAESVADLEFKRDSDSGYSSSISFNAAPGSEIKIHVRTLSADVSGVISLSASSSTVAKSSANTGPNNPPPTNAHVKWKAFSASAFNIKERPRDITITANNEEIDNILRYALGYDTKVDLGFWDKNKSKMTYNQLVNAMSDRNVIVLYINAHGLIQGIGGHSDGPIPGGAFLGIQTYDGKMFSLKDAWRYGRCNPKRKHPFSVVFFNGCGTFGAIENASIAYPDSYTAKDENGNDILDPTGKRIDQVLAGKNLTITQAWTIALNTEVFIGTKTLVGNTVSNETSERLFHLLNRFLYIGNGYNVYPTIQGVRDLIKSERLFSTTQKLAMMNEMYNIHKDFPNFPLLVPNAIYDFSFLNSYSPWGIDLNLEKDQPVPLKIYKEHNWYHDRKGFIFDIHNLWYPWNNAWGDIDEHLK